MRRTALLIVVAAAIVLSTGCRHRRTTVPSPGPEPLAPSPRIIVGRIVAVDPARGFAHLELAPDAPPAAMTPGTDLMARTLDLRETAQLRASDHLRGRTLGTRILGGQPAPGDEVVWLAP